MWLMTEQAIGARHLFVVRIVTTETGRRTDMASMAGDAVPVMRTGIAAQLRFNLRMTTGADRS